MVLQDVVTSVAPHLLEQVGTIAAVLAAVFGKQEFDRRKYKNGNGKNRRNGSNSHMLPVLLEIKESLGRLETGQGGLETKMSEIGTELGNLRVEVARHGN